MKEKQERQRHEVMRRRKMRQSAGKTADEDETLEAAAPSVQQKQDCR